MIFLRIKDVISIPKSTIWLLVKEEKFPKSIKLSERVTI